MAMTEYICAQCWHSFEADDSSDEALTCPACGAEQPNTGASASDSAEETVSESVEDGPAIPPVDEVPSEETSEPGEEAAGSEGEEEEVSTDDWASLDANKCGWKVRSGGLTYNFHGISALQNWCSGKKGLDSMEVCIEDKDLWRNLQEFRRLLRKQDPIEAYRTMGGEVSDDEPVEEPKAPMKPKETRSKESAPVAPRSTEDHSSRPSKPSVRTTGEFTFRVGEAPAPAGKNWTALGGGFVIGLLFGLALYFLGILSALDIEPLLSLGGG